jgi:hypothetical protein
MDYILQIFSKKFKDFNPEKYLNESIIYGLSYAILLLETNFEEKSEKMNLEEFKEITKGF